MLENANALKEQFLEKVNSATSSAELEQLRIEFLGKKGPITSLMSELRNIPNEQKKEAGQIINEVKQFIEKTLGEKNEEKPKWPDMRRFDNNGDFALRDRADLDEYKFKADITFCVSNTVTMLEYYHNSSYLEYGGSPDKAVKSAFVFALDKYLKNNNKYNKLLDIFIALPP